MNKELLKELAALGGELGLQVLEHWQRQTNETEFQELAVMTSALAAQRIVERLGRKHAITAGEFTYISTTVLYTSLGLIEEMTGKSLAEIPADCVEILSQYVYDKMKGRRS